MMWRPFLWCSVLFSQSFAAVVASASPGSRTFSRFSHASTSCCRFFSLSSEGLSRRLPAPPSRNSPVWPLEKASIGTHSYYVHLGRIIHVNKMIPHFSLLRWYVRKCWMAISPWFTANSCWPAVASPPLGLSSGSQNSQPFYPRYNPGQTP